MSSSLPTYPTFSKKLLCQLADQPIVPSLVHSFIGEHLCTDCTALTVGIGETEETIFNSYDTSRSILQKLVQLHNFELFSNHCEYVIQDIRDSDQDAFVKIYKSTYLVHVRYVAASKMFFVDKYIA